METGSEEDSRRAGTSLVLFCAMLYNILHNVKKRGVDMRDMSYLKDMPIAILGSGAVGKTLAADCWT